MLSEEMEVVFIATAEAIRSGLEEDLSHFAVGDG